MFPYHRLYEIFERIQLETLGSHELAVLFGVSERTIRSDIQTMNNILQTHGAQIVLKRKEGYLIEILNKKIFHEFKDMLHIQKSNTIELDSFEMRIQFLLKELLYRNHYTTLDDLADLLFISRNTLNNYMKTIRPIIEKYDLECISKANEGYKIIGNENNKRKCLLENVISHNMESYLTGFTKEEILLFDGLDLERIKTIVTQNINTLGKNISISDFNLKNIIIHFALSVSRILNNYNIDTYQPIKIQSEVVAILKQIKQQLEKEFDIEINDAEINYIYSHFAANTNYGNNATTTQEVNAIVKEVLNNIYRNYSFDLRNDECLCKDLFAHFSSILNFKQYSIDKKNPLLNTIKNNFPLAFEITLTAIREIFETKPYQLTEDEIGYVALHIGAGIERCFSGVMQRKKVILVCGSGNATIRMLEARLDAFFKDKIKIEKKISYNEFLAYQTSDLKNIDFVISTIPIRSECIPSICIDFALNTKDIEAISKFMGQINPSKSKRISRFFDEQLFLKPNVHDKNTLLKTMCNQLQVQGYCDSSFYESVMRRESIAHTNMNDIFALPHPMELCAKTTKVCVAILKDPIVWDKENTVKIIFLLAIKQNELLDIEYLYEALISIVNDITLQEQLINVDSYAQFLDLLNSHL